MNQQQYSHANLTKDSQGYVYWRGIQVDHYSFGRGEKAEVEEQKAADEMIARCLYLEKIGIEVDGLTTVWTWDLNAPDAEEKRLRGIHPSIPENIPIKLARLVTRLCERYGIRSCCDIPYWCNAWLAGWEPWMVYPCVLRSDYPWIAKQFAALKIDHLRSERRVA